MVLHKMKNTYFTIFALLFLFIYINNYSRDSSILNIESLVDISIQDKPSVIEANNLTSLGQLRLSLYESNALANNENAVDGVLIFFDTNGNNAVDANDAPDIPNLDENFSINNGGILLSIETRAEPEDQEEVLLEVNTYRDTNYTIVAEGVSIQTGIPFLYDNYTDVYTEIPQNGIINYAYSVNSGIPQSIAGDRFKIIFEVETLSTGNSDLDNILLYPNPTDLGKFYVNVPLGMNDLSVSIYNMLGSKLYSGKGYIGGSTITIESDKGLSIGTYFVELKSKGKTTVKKLIVI